MRTQIIVAACLFLVAIGVWILIESLSETQTVADDDAAASESQSDEEPAADDRPTKKTPDEEAIEIPLKEIWALDMPGTRPMNRNIVGEPPTYAAKEGRLVEEIRTALKYDPKRPVAGEGFAVRGEGMEALRDAHAVLVEGKEKRKTFRKGEKISLVFYSHSFGFYVHIVGVKQRGDSIKVTYRFVAHKTKEMSQHFALIPISIPKTEKIRVEIVMGKANLFAGMDASKLRRWTRKIVCRSFVIDIVEK